MGKINVKSNKGFTIADLAIALIIFILFTEIIGTLFYSSFRLNSQAKISAVATNYAIEILEDIDRIAYEDVQNGMEAKYMEQFQIPEGYQLSIIVQKYNLSNDKSDLVKKVKLTLEYGMMGRTEQIVIQRLKVKEI